MTEENNTIITFRQQLSDVFSRSGLPQLIGEEQKTFDGIDKLEKEGGRGVIDSFGSCYDYKMAGGTPDDDRDGM